MAKAWRKAYKKATGVSARKGITSVQKSSGGPRRAARKAVRSSARALMRGMGSSYKGQSSKAAVRRTAKKVSARSGLTGKAATRQARRIVRGRKYAKS